MKKLNELITDLTKEFDIQSVLCYGSYAVNMNDAKSDVDLLVLVSGVVPSNDRRVAAYEKFPNLKIITISKDNTDWDQSWSPVNDKLVIDNQIIDVGFNTTTWVNHVIENLIGKSLITFPEFQFRPYTFLGLLETCKILYDKENYIDKYRSQIKPIPEKLKNEIINSFLPILRESYEDLADYSQRDIGILAFEFMLFRAIDALIQLLYVINDVYDPASKRTEKFLFQLKNTPENLQNFINSILPRFFENKNEVISFLKNSIKFIERNINIGEEK